ncbi:MAG: S1 RNA-binding domain-containing protein, partial [Acidobacteriota bacterium]
VQRLESFGAFVQLKPGVEGLVHISELGQGRRLNHPREVLQVGQKIPVRVLSLDPVKKRISLAPVHDAELASSEPAMRQLLDQHRTGEQGLGSLAAAFAKKRKL